MAALVPKERLSTLLVALSRTFKAVAMLVFTAVLPGVWAEIEAGRVAMELGDQSYLKVGGRSELRALGLMRWA